MNSLTIYSDKKSDIKFNLSIDGAQMSNVNARICFEFESGQNIYYKCKINESGECSVNIPPIKFLEGSGTAIVEVVADDTFFSIHQMPFLLKKKIEVKTDFSKIVNEEIIEEKPKVGISFISSDTIEQEPLKIEVKEESKYMNNRIANDSSIKSFKEFINS